MAYDDIVSSMVLELRRGTLVMLVLSQLREPAYGYALVKSLADHGIPIEANTLYPLMRRLESQGLLASEWDNGGSKPNAQILPHHRRGPARAARSGGPVARSVRRGGQAVGDKRRGSGTCRTITT